jgi:hypothetical protein
MVAEVDAAVMRLAGNGLGKIHNRRRHTVSIHLQCVEKGLPQTLDLIGLTDLLRGGLLLVKALGVAGGGQTIFQRKIVRPERRPRKRREGRRARPDFG